VLRWIKANLGGDGGRSYLLRGSGADAQFGEGTERAECLTAEAEGADGLQVAKLPQFGCAVFLGWFGRGGTSSKTKTSLSSNNHSSTSTSSNNAPMAA